MPPMTPGLSNLPAFTSRRRHAHRATRREGEDARGLQLAHRVVKVGARHIRRAMPLAVADPDGSPRRAVLRRRAQFIRTRPRRTHEHIVSLRHADQDAVFFYRLHVLPVGGNDRHRPARELEIEESGRRPIDDAHADILPRLRGDAVLRLAVREEAIVGDVREIHRRHPQQLALPEIAQLSHPHRSDHRLRIAPLKRRPFAAALEPAQDFVRIFIRPIREHHGRSRSPLTPPRRGKMTIAP